MAVKKKRTLSPAQKAALAKGRKKLAAKKATRKTVKRVKRTRKHTSLGAELKPLLLTEGTSKMATRKRKTATKKRKTTARRYGSDLGYEGKRKRTRRHVRRYSGAGRGGKLDIVKPLINSGVAVAGGVAGSFIANKIPVSPKIKAAIPLALGLVLDMTKIGRKNPMVQAAATGMMVVGGLALARQFFPTAPLLAGEEEVSMLDTNVDPTLLGAPIELGEEFNFSADDDEYLSPADL